MSMREAVEMLVRAVVEHPEAVEVTATEGERLIQVEIRVAPGDVGKVIGRQGRVIKAIRRLANAATVAEHRRVTVEIGP
jgi:predicted RNA-binding protein YlqC (UPF0109 family)